MLIQVLVIWIRGIQIQHLVSTETFIRSTGVYSHSEWNLIKFANFFINISDISDVQNQNNNSSGFDDDCFILNYSFGDLNIHDEDNDSR